MTATSVEGMLHGDKCGACGKPFRDPNVRQSVFVVGAEPRSMVVGPECYRKVIKAKDVGFKPASGPRLFFEERDARAAFHMFGADS